MTIVVAMRMFVRHRFVSMQVRVTFDQQQCNADEKERSRNRVHHRKALAKNYDGQRYTKKGSTGEQYLSTRGADCLGGSYIEHDTRPIRQCADQQSEYHGLKSNGDGSQGRTNR